MAELLACTSCVALLFLRRSNLFIGSDFLQRGRQLVNSDALLFGRIPVTHRYGIVFQRLEVDDDTRWRAYLVLAAVALANVAVVIPHDIAKFFL